MLRHGRSAASRLGCDGSHPNMEIERTGYPVEPMMPLQTFSDAKDSMNGD